MPAGKSLSQLVSDVASEPNSEVALELIVQGALEGTGSRSALIAVLNQELGHLEIRLGAGEEFQEIHKSERLPIDVGLAEGIVAFVAATGKPLMTGNVVEEPHYRQLFAATQSEMAVPIRDRNGRIRGVLNVESDVRDDYVADDLDLLTAIAGLAGMILEQEEHEKRERALIEIGTSLDTALTEEALIDRVITVAEEVLRLEACSIFLIDPGSDTFVLRATVGRLKREVGKIGYTLGEGFTGWVCETGQPIMLNDPQSDPRWRGKYVEFPSDQIASFLAVPIKARKKCIGVIRVLRRKSENRFLDVRFDINDQRLLQAIAEQVAVGLENLRNIAKIMRSERMIAWGELSAKSSHMIGNRVFALKGDVNELRHLLEEREPDLTEIREIQKSLSTNVTRVEEILQDFRDFVTATQLDRQPTDLNRVVKETLDEVFPRRSRVALELEITENLPPVLMDAKKMRRAISELIENSLNYMEEGRLRVATSLQDKRGSDLTKASKIANFARLEIEDTGPGIERDQKSTIFQPFFSNRVKGMGLGLSIVKGIVDAHGGFVYEAGQKGDGAKFVILLPVTD